MDVRPIGTLEAARSLIAGSGPKILNAMDSKDLVELAVAMASARQNVKTGVVLARTQQEMDDALLDILV